MDWKKALGELLGTTALAAISPWIILILAVVGVVLLLIPIVIIWAYGFLTGVIWGIVTLLFIFVLNRAKLIDVEKYSWIIFIPIVAFFAGVLMEKLQLCPALQVHPILSSSSNLTVMSLFSELVNLNISLSEILLAIIVVLLAAGLIIQKD